MAQSDYCCACDSFAGGELSATGPRRVDVNTVAAPLTEPLATFSRAGKVTDEQNDGFPVNDLPVQLGVYYSNGRISRVVCHTYWMP